MLDLRISFSIGYRMLNVKNTWYIVIRHNAHELMYYSYMKLESVDVPCYHLFAVKKYVNMKIPSRCVLQWWTVGAIEYITLNEDAPIQEKEDVIRTRHEGNKYQPFGIGDPKVITAKGAPKGKGKGLVASAIIQVICNAHKLEMLALNL